MPPTNTTEELRTEATETLIRLLSGLARQSSPVVFITHVTTTEDPKQD